MQNPIQQRFSQDRNHLIARFPENGTENFLTAHAGCVDAYFKSAYTASLTSRPFDPEKSPFALIALGGYGRQEHCIYSDIDLLILFENAVPAGAATLVENIVYPLWDLGIEVGHATRAINENLAVAGTDPPVLTSLLDARFICGALSLFDEMNERLQKTLIAPRQKELIQWLVESNQARHRRYGDSSFRLKPNLKEGQGGLRDYHTIRWIVRVLGGLTERRDLEYGGYLSHLEYADFENALQYIFRVRNFLHHVAGRKTDQLYLEYQERLAPLLGYTTGDRLPVEYFLGRLHREMERIKHQRQMFLYGLGFGPRTDPGRHPSGPRRNGICVEKGMLCFTAAAVIHDQPAHLMWIFEESARLALPLSPEAKRLVRDFSPLVDDNFRFSPAIIKSFEQIMAAPAHSFNVLEEMLVTGLLAAFLPDFSRIANRIQFDEYHLFPVDRHSVRVVQTLKSIGTERDPVGSRLCVTLMKSLKKKRVLMWAALLHDIGKGLGDGADHSNTGARHVKAILAGRGLSRAEVETAAFLVKAHLFLVKTATRRDISDEETAIFGARYIQKIERLKMLYLLTVADSLATGPKAWNDWTAALLRDYFLKVLNVLEGGELASRHAVRVVERKRRALLNPVGGKAAQKNYQRLINMMSPRYLLAVPVKVIRSHVKLYESLGDKSFSWEITVRPETGTREIAICTRDRPGLIALISGVFFLNSLRILDVQAYTWRNRYVLDIFSVAAPPDPAFEDEKWDKTGRILEQSLNGALDLEKQVDRKMAALPRPSVHGDRPAARVRIDNDSSDFFTIIEVFSADYPGLLFKITDAFFDNRLDVWVAKIATKVDQVVDVFYVRDFDGQKIEDPDVVDQIRTHILAVLGTVQTREENDEKN